jgi:Mu-like prophage I protein
VGKTLTASDVRHFYRLTDLKPGPVGRADGQTQGARVTTNVPVFPEGEVEHPEYGTLDFSPENLREYVANWENRVRKIEVPVDLDHKNEEAAGWIQQLSYQPGSGVYATVEWNRHGQELLNDKRYRYLSPQFGDYTDEQTGETYKNVLIALTLTNFPFLKEMGPVSLSERRRRQPSRLVDRARAALLAEYSHRDRRLFDRELRKLTGRSQTGSRAICRSGCSRCTHIALTSPRARRSIAL